MWLSHPGFMQLVYENWSFDLNGAPPFVFTSKLKRLKEVLKIWNKTVFGDVKFRLKQDELKLEIENDLLDYDPADEFQFLKVADAKKAVDDVRTELAIMLKMKSRVTWLEDGDQNTRFFHNSIRMRRSKNTISQFKVSNDTTLFLQDEIKDFIVNHYQAKFNGGDVHIDPVLFDIEHESILVAESAYMDAIPSLEEVRVAVFDLGADSAPGPNGFTGSFYRQCWDIISRDLFNAIANCWIGTVLSKLISEDQVAFMKGINIHENIALASELINEINTERKHGNVSLKLDIAQAFDTVSWDFIAEVFRQYGFSDSWCMWVLNILSSARISVMINGCPEGYFSITRGLRQGDPLSPLIFVLIEDVLSRNISKLFANNSMNVMVSKKGVAPTHLLFADDILIFCKGNLHSLQNLKNMLVLYERASGQYVNFAKSKFYFGGDIISRAIAISNYLSMERVMFPDKYLGIQLKPGIVRHIHVRQVVEKIMDKLAGWKGKLLSFQARIVLIKSVISSYVIHSMVVYKWPCTVIKQVERAIRNFLWSGDAKKRKYFTVLYDDLCLSKREGGLGIKKLNDVNRAMLMKLWISIRDSNKIWARFLRSKYFKVNGNLINYKLGSSVFPGIRLVYNFVQKHTRSIIVQWLGFKGRVYQVIHDNSVRMKGHMYNTLQELRILNYFKVRHRSRKTSTPIEISWIPPNQDEIMICFDGASFGNPEQAGSGVVFRDASSEVLGVLCVGLGWKTNLYAEDSEVPTGTEVAVVPEDVVDPDVKGFVIGNLPPHPPHYELLRLTLRDKDSYSHLTLDEIAKSFRLHEFEISFVNGSDLVLGPMVSPPADPSVPRSARSFPEKYDGYRPWIFNLVASHESAPASSAGTAPGSAGNSSFQKKGKLNVVIDLDALDEDPKAADEVPGDEDMEDIEDTRLSPHLDDIDQDFAKDNPSPFRATSVEGENLLVGTGAQLVKHVSVQAPLLHFL
ncbi:uncharacterized protein LOC113306234 [Papaver somniferum]|uniref:uncharacterized protein LOC113306234 n=1 Tax=Papaver somniferum TaxID=3469 RepID=UPI000E70498E|nr:uncharacterized protein LOC113306234 [Papaver somniferum]